MTWHADRDLLAAYTQGALDDAARWSLEEHVATCTRCRTDLSSLAVPGGDLDHQLEAIWRVVVFERETAQRRSPVERLLVRAGVTDHRARLVAATPALTLSWLLGVAVTLAVAVAAAWATHAPGNGTSGAPLLFLVLAPLLPLAGVAVSFGPGIDPTYDISLAAPMQTGRLLLVRSMAVLVSTLPLALVAGLALPELNWTAAAWLLPTLALTGTALAMSTRVAPLIAGGLLAVLWVAGVTLVEGAARTPLVAFGAPTQALMGVLAVGAAAYLARHHDRFDRKTVR